MSGSSWLGVALLGALLLAVPLQKALGEGAIGQPAPALAVETLAGLPFDLASLRGRVVVVNLWATWCPPCREEMPFLDTVYRQYHRRGLELLGMSVDRPRDRKRVKQVMASFSYPAALIGDATANGFGSPGILPVTYVVDAEGVLRAVLTGADDKPLTKEELVKAVLPLLPKGPDLSSH